MTAGPTCARQTPMPTLDAKSALALSDQVWESAIVPALTEYIRIPNQSQAFDKGWATAGHMDRAVELIAGWCKQQAIPGLTVEVIRLAGRTPLIFMEAPGAGSETVLLYGHLDKQPEMTGWRAGLSAWAPAGDPSSS